MDPAPKRETEALVRALSAPGGASSDFDLNPAFAPPDQGLRSAGVLAVLGCENGRPGFLLTLRSPQLRHHPGQIAFPGGKVDPGDADEVAAALRESHEEVGLPVAAVRILGTLPTHRTVTGFSVTPVVGVIEAPFHPVPEPGEVEEIFVAPWDHVMDRSRYAIQSRMWRGQTRRFYSVPWGPYYIWGATARILRGLAERVAL